MDGVQYCVILREGVNKGLEEYFWISKTKLQKIFDSFEFDNGGEVFAALGHIAGNDLKHGEIEDMVEINKKKGMLKFKCRNEETAIKCMNYWGFSYWGLKDSFNN